MLPDDVRGPVVDYACGAGELLAPFSQLASVVEALDSAPGMRGEARRNLANTGVDLVGGDVAAHALGTTHPVWTTCQGLNQYLAPDELESWIQLFASNQSAVSMYLFDSVDPRRFRTLRTENRYETRPTTRWSRTRACAQSIRSGLASSSHRTWADIGGPAMGFGYTPEFFRHVGGSAGLTVRFASSLQFEYRFHVHLLKARQSNTKGGREA
jgi:hypothetical protein